MGAIAATSAAKDSWRSTVAYHLTHTRSAMSGSDLGADGPRTVGGPALALLGGSDQDRDLSQVAVVAQQLVGFGDALEAHRLPQDGPDLRLLDQLVGLGGLPGVGEMRSDDLLLAHPQIADVKVELVTRRGPADHDLAKRLDHEHGGREGRLADMLEHYVRRAPEDLLDGLAEASRLLEARPFLVGVLASAAHHALELLPIDVAHGSELLDQPSLVVAGDHAQGVGPAECAQLGGEHPQAAGGAPDQDLVTG